MKRRTLLVGGAGAAGALIVGWAVLPPRDRLGGVDTLPSVDGEIGLNGWIRIAGDGNVRLAMNRSEMGQGVHTALAMLVAEELDVGLDQVTLIPAGDDALYGNVAMVVRNLPVHPDELEAGRATTLVSSGQWVVAKIARELGVNATGGSTSVVDAWDVLRLAAATARARLVGAASLQWKFPVSELTVERGVVSHRSGMRAGYGDLARMARAAPSGDVRLKTPEEWKLIGTPAPRIDVVAKSNGTAVFGVDVRPPGLVYAAIRHCPMLGGALATMDPARALALPGVLRVVRLGPYGGSTSAVAAVAQTWWHARRGVDAVDATWQQRPGGGLDSADIEATLEHRARDAAAADSGWVFYGRGDAPSVAKAGERVVERAYRAPYLAHAAMEPMTCTARVAEGRVEVWVPTQVPGLARAIAAEVAEVPLERVDLHVTYLGGGFGRRLDVDVVGQAVRIAIECGGLPVQLMWSREEDTTHDFYRPAGSAVLRAAVDAEGMPTSLSITSAGDAITPRWIERTLPHLAGPVDTPDKTTSEGLYDQAYGIPRQRIAHVATRTGVPIGFWRSVGHSHNAFFSESFFDELAHEAGQDPFEFRAALLRTAPRHLAVLRLVADRAGWPGRPGARSLPPGQARGIALHESFGSIVAQVVETSVDAAGHPRVHRVVCAADVGRVVNPGIVAQQLEGGVMFALSAALYGRIEIRDGVVQQRNYPDQPVIRMAEAPVVETHLVVSTRSPGGVGEIGVPPLAPALANALFALTGERRRSLPLGAARAGGAPGARSGRG